MTTTTDPDMNLTVGYTEMFVVSHTSPRDASRCDATLRRDGPAIEDLTGANLSEDDVGGSGGQWRDVECNHYYAYAWSSTKQCHHAFSVLARRTI